MGKELTVVIKPTRDCNLRCKYCSVGDPDSVYMSKEIVESAIEKIVKREPESSTKFIWHGGEPLLPGLEFYRHIINFQNPLRKQGYKIYNCIQSNGTLVNDKWAEFFKEYNFAVGLSIDGPKAVNDKTRIFEGGKGAFDAIHRGAKILEKHGVKFSYLVVISQQNAASIDEIISFMKEQEKLFKLVAVAPIGRAAGATEKLMTKGNSYSKSQLRLFQRWLEEGDIYERSALWKYVVPVLTGEPIECIFLKDCQQEFIGVDSNGDAYPCGRFCGGGKFLYGNLVTDTFETIWNNPIRLELTKRPENLSDKCKKCEFITICNGGCPLQGYLNGGINKPDYNCGQYRQIFNEIKKTIIKEAGLEGKV